MNKAEVDPRFTVVLNTLKSGTFGEPSQWRPIVQSLESGNDYYLLGVDFASYLSIQEKVDEAFLDRKTWLRMSILSTAGAGKFSSDRTIHEYAEEIWGIEQVRRPGAKPVQLQRLTAKGIVPESSELGISPSFHNDVILVESQVPLVRAKYPQNQNASKANTQEGEAVEGFDIK